MFNVLLAANPVGIQRPEGLLLIVVGFDGPTQLVQLQRIIVHALYSICPRTGTGKVCSWTRICPNCKRSIYISGTSCRKASWIWKIWLASSFSHDLFASLHGPRRLPHTPYESLVSLLASPPPDWKSSLIHQFWTKDTLWDKIFWRVSLEKCTQTLAICCILNMRRTSFVFVWSKLIIQ